VLSVGFRSNVSVGSIASFWSRPTTSGLPLETDVVRAGRHVSKVPRGDMASHLQMKRGRLSWRPLFPYLELTWARLCTQMAGYIENAETPETA
jgi:hypothetical protein